MRSEPAAGPGPSTTGPTLGPVIKQYPLRHGRLITWLLISISVMALAGSVLLLIGGAILFNNHYYRFGPAFALNDLPLLILGAVLLGAIGVYIAARATAISGSLVTLHPGGVISYEGRGSSLWPWESIISLQSSVYDQYTLFRFSGTRHRYRLVNHLGVTLLLDDAYEGVSELAETIRTRLFPLLLEKARQAYQQGQTVSFGSVALDARNGIHIGKLVYPWNCIQAAGVEKGTLVITVREGYGKPIRISGDKLLNADVLLAILANLIPGAHNLN